MQYLVLAADGKEYGPASIDTLKQWIVEERLAPNSQLRDFTTGQLVLASSVADLFPPQPASSATPPPMTQWSQAPSTANYVRPALPGSTHGDTGMGDVWGAIIRSGLAIVFFFFLHGIGIIFAGYGLYYAIQAQAKGHRLGWVAVVISSVTIVAIGIGWLLRFNGVWT